MSLWVEESWNNNDHGDTKQQQERDKRQKKKKNSLSNTITLSATWWKWISVVNPVLAAAHQHLVTNSSDEQLFGQRYQQENEHITGFWWWEKWSTGGTFKLHRRKSNNYKETEDNYKGMTWLQKHKTTAKRVTKWVKKEQKCLQSGAKTSNVTHKMIILIWKTLCKSCKTFPKRHKTTSNRHKETQNHHKQTQRGTKWPFRDLISYMLNPVAHWLHNLSTSTFSVQFFLIKIQVFICFWS